MKIGANFLQGVMIILYVIFSEGTDGRMLVNLIDIKRLF